MADRNVSLHVRLEFAALDVEQGCPALCQMAANFESLSAGLWQAQQYMGDFFLAFGGSDMSSTPDGPLYDYQGQLEEAPAAKRPEIYAVWPSVPGWGSSGANPLRDIYDFKAAVMRRSTRLPAHPVHPAPETHWKRYWAGLITGHNDITRDFDIPCWLDEVLAFAPAIVPPPTRGGTFFYCPWQERRYENGRMTYWSCGVGHAGWATGTRHRSAAAYRRHYRRCHLS